MPPEKEQPPTTQTTLKDFGERLALLASCNKCGTFFEHACFERSLDRVMSLGSKKAPLRAYCPKCRHHIRLHSKRRTNIHAEVPYSRLRQVADLRDLAKHANTHLDCEGSVLASDMYIMWNDIVGYSGKGVPMPFKRFRRRGGL